MVTPVCYCVGKNTDIRRLPRLLTLFPQHVLVQSASGECRQLTTFVHGPFYTRQESGHWILVGTRVSDEKTACLRIIDFDNVPVLQWKESLVEAWRTDPGWVPSEQLLVPSVVLFSKP